MIIKLTSNINLKPKEFDDLRHAEKFINNSNYGENYYKHHIPKLPKWTDKNLRCQEYKVNLFQLKCSCDDYKENRSKNYFDNDVRLCCKHIYWKLSDRSKNLSKYLDSLTLKLAGGTALKNEKYFYKHIIYGEIIIYGFIPESDWVGVYSRVSNGDFFRYSYNPIIQKWSNRLIPRQENYIVEMLEKTIRYQLPYSHNFLKLTELKNNYGGR